MRKYIIRIQMLHLTFVLLFLVLLFSVGCDKRKEERELLQRIEIAKKNSIRFLDSISGKIDPVRLRQEHGMKGKTFFVCYLNAYLIMYTTTQSDSEKTIYKNKIADVLAPSQTPEYHNLGTSSPKEFRQDVISYLNACRLLGKFGFDTKSYKEEIEKIYDRIIDPAHLSRRGVDNTMALSYMLNTLGFEKPYSYCEIYQRPDCVLRSHPDYTNINLKDQMETTRAYDITHEIFYLTNFGANPLECADASDFEYAEETLSFLLTRAMEQDNPDIAAELCVCLDYLRMYENELYDECITYLLESQNEDGSWGDYDWAKEYVKENRPEYIVEVGLNLHTVRVVLWALTLTEKRLRSGL
ncbi:MAG: hypothetical protein P9L92_08700 [Candidatus Electryonea clarkiae]|nr:hypothetical protein [Candidatus Electryonea clarkiae]MDP8287428.1 hypothetical protein [Candidatus Electryonea clarkiae]